MKKLKVAKIANLPAEMFSLLNNNKNENQHCMSSTSIAHFMQINIIWGVQLKKDRGAGPNFLPIGKNLPFRRIEIQKLPQKGLHVNIAHFLCVDSLRKLTKFEFNLLFCIDTCGRKGGAPSRLLRELFTDNPPGCIPFTEGQAKGALQYTSQKYIKLLY